jgi:hypothetical protein
MRKVGMIVLAGVAALALSGCYTQVAHYTINDNGTVDARIRVFLLEEYLDLGAPYRGVPVQEILDHFTTDTIVQDDDDPWYGYVVYLDDEPMSHFADPAAASWDIEIRSDGDNWVVLGIEYDPAQDVTREAIIDNAGHVGLGVAFPGELVDEIGTEYVSYPAPGYAQWDMLTTTDQPYAVGRKAAPAPPEPDDPPEPDPVVIPIVTPSLAVTPSGTPSPSATATPSPIPAEVLGDGDNGIPAWAWGVGGLLLGSLAGLGTFMIVNRPKEEPEPEETKLKDAKPKDAKPAETAKKGKKNGNK